MLKLFASAGEELVPVEHASQASWLLVSEPDDEDIEKLQAFGIPPLLLSHVRDANERPRVERQDNTVLIVLHFPYRLRNNAPTPFKSMPLSIILTDERIVTVTPHVTGFVEEILKGDVRELSTATPAQFVLKLVVQLANEYLNLLDEIDRAVEHLENKLQRSQSNREVLALLRYEKSLVYFTTSLASNELLLQRLQKGSYLKWSEDDRRSVDDVMIEVHQAMEMVNIAQNILSQMMDAFASIVSNNLNSVMKFLTSVTIIVSIPTLVASVYGMNVRLPGAEHPLAFTAIAVVSIVAMLLLLVVFARKHWF